MITILKKGDLIDDRYLRLVDTPEVRAIVSAIAEKRNHELRSNGFSKDKEIRATGSIPREIYFHPAFRHIFHPGDSREEAENTKRFLNERPAFRLVGRL